MSDSEEGKKIIASLGVRAATEKDVITLAHYALFHVPHLPIPLLVFLLDRPDAFQVISVLPMPPDREVIRSFVEDNDFEDMPWHDIDDPLYGVVYIVHAKVQNPKGEDVLNVRLAGAATVGGGYTSAWQPDNFNANAVGATPEGWDAIKQEGLDEPLHALVARVNGVLARRREARG